MHNPKASALFFFPTGLLYVTLMFSVAKQRLKLSTSLRINFLRILSKRCIGRKNAIMSSGWRGWYTSRAEIARIKGESIPNSLMLRLTFTSVSCECSQANSILYNWLCSPFGWPYCIVLRRCLLQPLFMLNEGFNLKNRPAFSMALPDNILQPVLWLEWIWKNIKPFSLSNGPITPPPTEGEVELPLLWPAVFKCELAPGRYWPVIFSNRLICNFSMSQLTYEPVTGWQ